MIDWQRKIEKEGKEMKRKTKRYKGSDIEQWGEKWRYRRREMKE